MWEQRLVMRSLTLGRWEDSRASVSATVATSTSFNDERAATFATARRYMSRLSKSICEYVLAGSWRKTSSKGTRGSKRFAHTGRLTSCRHESEALRAASLAGSLLN